MCLLSWCTEIWLYHQTLSIQCHLFSVCFICTTNIIFTKLAALDVKFLKPFVDALVSQLQRWDLPILLYLCEVLESNCLIDFLSFCKLSRSKITMHDSIEKYIGYTIVNWHIVRGFVHFLWLFFHTSSKPKVGSKIETHTSSNRKPVHRSLNWDERMPHFFPLIAIRAWETECYD